MAMVSHRKYPVLFFLIGLTVTFNWLVIPISGSSPRYTDMVALLMLVVVLGKLLTERLTLFGLAAVPVAICTLFWMISGALTADMSLAIFGMRLFLSLTAFLLVAQKIVEHHCEAPFLWGISTGAMIVGIIAMGQGTETIPLFNLFIPPGTDTWWGDGGRVRAVGIWQHPNSVGQVQALGAACALSLTFMGPRIRLMAFVAFLVIVGTTYAGTLNRAMIIACFVSGLVAVFGSRFKTLKTSGYVGGFFAVALAPFFLKQVLGDRWFGSGQTPSASENGAERIETLFYSFELVLEKPFGHGIIGSVDALIKAFGFSATHNSFVSIGLTLGLLPMITMIGMMLHRLVKIATSRHYKYEAVPLTAIYVLFFFEDSIFLPSMVSAFVIFTMWGQVIFIPAKAAAPPQKTPVLSPKPDAV